MPDLITHTSFNYIIYKLFKNKLVLSLFLLGAILPDIPCALSILFTDFFKIFNSNEYIIAYTTISHSLFVGMVLSILIGNLIKPEKNSILSIFTGYTLHLFLDFLQNNWGYGNLLFYPFSFKLFSLKLFTFGVEYKYIYCIFLLFIFIYIFLKEKKEILYFNFTFKKILLSITLFLVIVVLDINFINKTIKSNCYSIDLRFHPEKYHNKTILMNKIRLINTNPVMTEYRNQKMLLKNVKYIVNKQKAYYIEGIYNHKEKSVKVIKMIEVTPHIKAYISGFGLFLFILYFLLKVKIKLL